MHEAYAHALHASSKGVGANEQTKLVESFIGLLTRRGHMALLPKIVRSLQDIETRSKKDTSLLVTLSDHAHLKRFEEDIVRTEKEVFGDSHKRTISVDPSLVGGFVLKKGDTRVDASYKSHLLSFFNIVTGIQSK